MNRIVNALGAQFELNFLRLTTIPLDFNVPLVNVNEKSGEVLSGKITTNTRRINIRGPIYDVNSEQIRNEVNSLLTVIQHPPLQVFFDYEGRFIFAYPLSIPQNWRGYRKDVNIPLQLICPNPFFYGSLIEETDPIELNNEGNSPVKPVIEVDFSYSGSSIEIENETNDNIITIEHDFEEADLLVIDNENFVIELNGENIMNSVDDDWLINGFVLSPGNNELSYTGPEADVTYEYRPKWL